MILGLVGTVVFVGLGILGWGDVAGYFAHPARAAATGCSIALTVVAMRSGLSLGPGIREDARGRQAFLPGALGSVLLAWLPPYMDRRDIWTIDGDAARWIGLALLVAGGVLRVWPMFTLGRRFSPFVAIQQGHELVTDGIYRYLRHPSYLGGLVALIGWVLVFRSSVGLLLAVGGLQLTLARIGTEEELLASEFPQAWAEYCRHSWRLVPGVY
jgi:protein-S-isoprenylcysteine O-methyltransferase Ste14